MRKERMWIGCAALDCVPGARQDRRMRGGNYLIAAMALLASAAAQAADEPAICADRPGKATSTCTVPAGRWQVETGLADWSLKKGQGERDTLLVLGETTVKYGLTNRSDIEIDLTPWQRATSRGQGFHDTASGVGDVNVRYKQRLTDDDAPVQVSTLPFIKVPTAKHSLGNGKWEGGLLVPISFAIGKSPFSIGLTPELDWVADGNGHGHHAAMAQVASLGWQANARLNLSGEIWGQWDWDPSGTGKQASADAAVAYLLSDDFQLDAGANFGLNKQTPGLELYFGVSKRF